MHSLVQVHARIWSRVAHAVTWASGTRWRGVHAVGVSRPVSFARDRGVASAKDARERPGPCHVYVPGFLPFRNVVGWLSRGRLDFVASPQPTGWAAHGGMESSCAAPARRANAIY